MPRGNVDNFKGKRRVPKLANCHPGAKHYAHGLCLSCYCKKVLVRKTKQNRTSKECLRCHKVKRILAYGKCSSCYNVGRKEAKKLKRLESQGGKCAVLGCTTDTFEYRLSDWQLDHDHKCCPPGRWCDKCVRGVICRPCNLVLGSVNDNIDHLTGLQNYLKRNGCQ